ncbi:pre-peptidase C-terminal domain-containing protein [Paenibacillus sp. SYP-B3998]|uniref:pre-peptidase C-terminal domain-containing protein n=1 Tax=Paenibacillus sp. SYP-B3998 TaxID=2678564 RepID=UPI001F07B32E|nr:pre-peptidase C-terminal domain-containing protein [Paenibacillus sp. SYP-B3998]
MSVSLLGAVPQAFAEGPNDPAPTITPITANGKKVLFDNTHGQTAGAADWVIDGGFSDFANALGTAGYYVKELRKTSPIILSDLSAYDVVVIGEANIPYKTSEQSALLQYVQNGGSIFFIGDHYNADRNKNRWDASEVFNGYRRGAWTNPAAGMSTDEAASGAMQGVASSDWLATNFGVRFRYNALGDITANNIVSPSQAFGITTGVSKVAMHAGSTLAVTDPNKAKGIVYLPTTTTKWANAVDQGVYNNGGVAEGPYVAVSKVSAGKAGFIGDSSPVEDASPKYKREETGGSKTTYAGFQEQNDATLLVNMVNWLSTKETYTSLGQVSGLTLDTATSLYTWEQPANTTEPQAEPWATPAAGYKWWDPTTFKSGSYGYGSTTTTDPYEPNDSLSTAYGSLASGATYNGYIGTSTDADWFKFTTAGSGTISVALNNLPANYDLYLYNASSTQLASSVNTNTTSEAISYNASVAGTYYIKVVGANGATSTSQAYALQATYPAGNNTAPFAFVHQAQLPNQAVFQVKVIVNGLTANSTTTGYNLGVYNGSGTQVAKVQNSDGTWPSSYGYSTSFSLTADANGHAEKIVNVQINPSISSAANMRLRQNTTAKFTEAVTIANVPAVPLP